MQYKSTRNKNIKINSAEAIINGISQEGGLFVPDYLPTIDEDFINKLVNKSYNERAKLVLEMFLTDFSKSMISECVDNAYDDVKFNSENITEISYLYDKIYMLELFWGPTCAFKDMALQLLPHLLTTSIKITKNEKEIIILVATSGDTGKAALEGFYDVPGTKIAVFYPENGVSPMQKRQMQTQAGDNVYVCAVRGNFDDTQTGVKKIFTDEAIKKELADKNKMFSSANSINWGRLLPQVVYYISAYCDLIKQEEIAVGDEINVVVPTGNFGNILAAYYAKKMGLPLKKLICASNKNNILTDFINTGVYDRNRDFYTTMSPSMDILISSNLERLLFDLADEDDNLINKWFNDLSKIGKYEVNQMIKDKLAEHFYADCCDDNETQDTISEIFNKYSYLCDTHTAVGVNVYKKYRAKTNDDTRVIIASTANPYKFVNSVLDAVDKDNNITDEYVAINKLNKISNMDIPESLKSIEGMSVIYNDVIDKEDMLDAVKSFIDKKKAL